jgi:hypothetical protein
MKLEGEEGELERRSQDRSWILENYRDAEAF